LPVPRWTTVAMIPLAVAAVSSESTRRRRGSLPATRREPASVSTRRIPTGPRLLAPSVPLTFSPPAAIVP
jgi:hypothetical protein